MFEEIAARHGFEGVGVDFYAGDVLAVGIQEAVARGGEGGYSQEDGLAAQEICIFGDVQGGDGGDSGGQVANQHGAAGVGSGGGDDGAADGDIAGRFGDGLPACDAEGFKR